MYGVFSVYYNVTLRIGIDFDYTGYIQVALGSVQQ